MSINGEFVTVQNLMAGIYVFLFLPCGLFQFFFVLSIGCMTKSCCRQGIIPNACKWRIKIDMWSAVS